MTLIFEDLQVQLGAGDGLWASVVHQSEATVTIGSDQCFLGYHAKIKGSVSCGTESRVVLIAHMAGTVKVVEFPGAVALAWQDDGLPPVFDQSFELEITAWDQYRPAEREPPGPSPPPFLLSLQLIVQRRDRSQDALLVVDSADIVALFERS